MLATEIMRASFATVTPATTLIDAVRLLLETNQRGLPVVDTDGGLVGILSEGDLLHRRELDTGKPPTNWFDQLLGLAEPAQDCGALTVANVMKRYPIFVGEEATVEDVVTEMDVHQVAQIPVVCGGRAIGIVSRFEVIAALERRLSRRAHGC